jgi:hypothetical protein
MISLKISFFILFSSWKFFGSFGCFQSKLRVFRPIWLQNPNSHSYCTQKHSIFLIFFNFGTSLRAWLFVVLCEIGENCDAFLGLPKSAVHLFQFSCFGMILECNDSFENFIFDLVFVLEIFWKLWLLQTNLASKPKFSLLFICTQKPSIFLLRPVLPL